MSEYCLDCWNELNGTNDPPEKYIISKDYDMCEGCGKWKNVVVRYKRSFPLEVLMKINRAVISPFTLLKNACICIKIKLRNHRE